MVEIRNGIQGKVCSTCKQWKLLDAFPTDPTHPLSQGGRHCRCKNCHRKRAAERRSVARNMAGAFPVFVLLLSIAVAAASKAKPSYQAGKLIDLSVQDVTMGFGVIGGIAAPIPGRLYVFQI